MKKLEKLQCTLSSSALLNPIQASKLKGGGDKRKDRPSDKIGVRLNLRGRSSAIKINLVNLGG